MKVELNFTGCNRSAGVERVMLECANFLHGRGHETHVHAAEWDASALDPGVICHSVAAPSRPAVSRILAFAYLSRRHLAAMNPPPDVVGAFGVMCPPGAVMWVQSVHRAWLATSQRRRNFSGRMRQRVNPFHWIILAMERYYYRGRRYKKLIALTELVKHELMHFYDVPAEDIVIIPNGFAPAEFSLARAASLRQPMRAKLGYEATDKVITFAANEFERKGFGPLIRAIAQLKDDRVRLLAVGRLNPATYAAEIERLGLSGRVYFPGPSADVAQFYAAADLFALPTQHEAWGLVITEAMACGLPVVTSRLAGAAKSVREGEGGELLDDPMNVDEIAAKLKTVLAGRHGSAEKIAASVAEYAWPRLLVQYETLLAECAAQPARVPSAVPIEGSVAYG